MYRIKINLVKLSLQCFSLLEHNTFIAFLNVKSLSKNF